MFVSEDLNKLIFGFKLRYYRNIRKMSLQQLSDASGISVSYINEIEKAKKYPSPSKIAAFAKALQVEYQDLSSNTGNKKIQPILDIFQSEIFKTFPIQDFGLDPLKLFELLSFSPDKVTAFISTIVKVATNYHLTQENFYISALRAFQDLHDNYFTTLEANAQLAKKEFFKTSKHTISYEDLTLVLREKYHIQIDTEKLSTEKSLSTIRSYYSPKKKILYIQNKLQKEQLKFLVAREFAFQFLELKERPYFTTTLEYQSFELLLNNFRASYLAAALLIDENSFSKDLASWMNQRQEDNRAFEQWMKTYEVSAETLLQRISNIMSGVFGIKDIFFLRLNTRNLSDYFITKEIHLSRQHQPHATTDDNLYCRRWISIKSIQEASLKNKNVVSSQISAYHQSPNAYYCVSLAKKDAMYADAFSSVTLGFLINDKMKHHFKFLQDKKILKLTVNNTCKTCQLKTCKERIADYTPDKTTNRLEIANQIVKHW